MRKAITKKNIAINVGDAFFSVEIVNVSVTKKVVRIKNKRVPFKKNLAPRDGNRMRCKRLI